MKKGPRRTRARAWAAVYLRLFGPGNADNGDGESGTDECEKETDIDDNRA